MSLTAEHLIHANVVCSDFERSLDFYTRILGASLVGEVMEFDGGEALADGLNFEGTARCKVAFLSWGDDTTCIDLLSWDPPGDRVERNTKDIGLARIAIRVRDFDAALDWLKHNGVELVGGPSELTLPNGNGRRLLAFRDPDGTLVECVEYAELLRR
jgi:glyoxylase I family protein